LFSALRNAHCPCANDGHIRISTQILDLPGELLWTKEIVSVNSPDELSATQFESTVQAPCLAELCRVSHDANTFVVARQPLENFGRGIRAGIVDDEQLDVDERLPEYTSAGRFHIALAVEDGRDH
jgi:hypothetical protein